MHGDLRSGRDSVVGVGHETRVHATLESVTWGIKGRLGDSVVLGEELKDDGITDRHLVQLLGLEDETSRATYGYGMRGTLCRFRGCFVSLDSGGGGFFSGMLGFLDNRVLSRLLCRMLNRLLCWMCGANFGCDGLGDGDLLIDSLGLRTATRVGPDDDDLCLGIGSDSVALHAIWMPLLDLRVSNGVFCRVASFRQDGHATRASHSQGSKSQRKSSGVLHDVIRMKT